ncbi:hypothetical protein T12_1301 [Trichinella patagoniensis]|uniref:Uncharacterized protein n=1 Tax=Trichinella patagoniensis TaxID=990121 RepID=A0A0V0ZGP8_9BILA|nr:hypothetical protein T12_1301 [Trichinella patagoniensis]
MNAAIGAPAVNIELFIRPSCGGVHWLWTVITCIMNMKTICWLVLLTFIKARHIHYSHENNRSPRYQMLQTEEMDLVELDDAYKCKWVIWFSIFRLLRTEDIMRLAYTSSEMNAMAQSYFKTLSDIFASFVTSDELVNAILSKQRNRLNLEMRGDLRLKLTNFQPNINALAAAHQTHPSH